MRYPVLTIHRRDLVAAGACADWLAAFDAAVAERDLERVPLEPHADGTPRYGVRPVERGPFVRRRDGSTYRAADRLRIELSPLAQVWLSLPVAPCSGTAWAWLRARGVVGAQNLTDAYLTDANLSGANLSDADLYGANLSGADLSGANLSGADLSGADLSGANLSGANLSGANLSGANLYGANLSGANLYGANLYGADLSGANLYGANLYGADLSGADLSGADLSGADLYGAYRRTSDRDITGWTVRDGRLERAS